MKKALTLISCATIALLATGSVGATQKKKRPAAQLVPFSATASFGEDVPILEHGPLTLLLECRQNSIGDIAILAVVSTEDDVLVTGEPSILVPPGDDRTLVYGSVPAIDGEATSALILALRTSTGAACRAGRRSPRAASC